MVVAGVAAVQSGRFRTAMVGQGERRCGQCGKDGDEAKLGGGLGAVARTRIIPHPAGARRPPAAPLCLPAPTPVPAGSDADPAPGPSPTLTLDA